jgi:hypothetical protein
MEDFAAFAITFSIDDALDLSKGARYIPAEVTLARRRGDRVIYNEAEKHWLFEDGAQIR